MKRQQKWRWSCWNRLVSLSSKRDFFFFFYIMFYMIFSSSLCDCASNSKDPSVENCFFWASFNARNLCCPWAINNSWRSVLEEYHNVHVCTRLHLWAYTFSWMCDCVFSNVCFSNGKWRNSVEALDSYYILALILKWLWRDSVFQLYMFLELGKLDFRNVRNVTN